MCAELGGELMRRRMTMLGQEEEEMSWKEVKTVYAENDGDVLFVDGFEAERIRITAMVGATTDNTGLRFSISKDLYDKAFNLGTSTSKTLMPLMFEISVVDRYAITTPFAYPKNVILINATNLVYCGGFELPSGEQLLKRFRISSANDKLIAGSWMKVEVWK